MVTRRDDHSPGTKRFRVIDLVIPADAEATLPYLVEAVRRLIPADRKAAMAARGESGRTQTSPFDIARKVHTGYNTIFSIPPHDCGANPGVEQHLDLEVPQRLLVSRRAIGGAVLCVHDALQRSMDSGLDRQSNAKQTG